MTRNCDLGLFPRLIEQWRLEEEAKEAEEARRIQLDPAGFPPKV